MMSAYDIVDSIRQVDNGLEHCKIEREETGTEFDRPAAWDGDELLFHSHYRTARIGLIGVSRAFLQFGVELSRLGCRETVIAAHSGAFHALATDRTCDAILVEDTIAQQKAWKFIRATRAVRNDLTMIVATPLGDPRVVAGALYAGADDVVAPDINSRELVARLSATMRRYHDAGRREIHPRHPFRLFGESKQVECRGQFVNFTATEYRLVSKLIRNLGRMIPTDELTALLKQRRSSSSKALGVHMYNIRRRLSEFDGVELKIETVRSMGLLATLSKPIGGK